jgi:hypothetical protein
MIGLFDSRDSHSNHSRRISHTTTLCSRIDASPLLGHGRHELHRPERMQRIQQQQHNGRNSQFNQWSFWWPSGSHYDWITSPSSGTSNPF